MESLVLRTAALTAALLCSTVALAADTAAIAERRHFEFTYDMVLEPPQDVGRIEAWLPVPTDVPGQDIGKIRIETTADYRFTTEATYGNRMIHMVAEGPGAGPIKATMTVEVIRHEYRGAETGDPNPRYLRPNKLVPIDGMIAELAERTTQGATSNLEKARAIYEFVTKTVSYDKTGTGWGRGDALFACDAKAGNCTDFHALFIAMARASGIPARFEIGFPLKGELETGSIGGYHCWAEFYIDGEGWIPVDSSEAQKNPNRHEYYFGSLDPHRVEFTKGRDLLLNPPQKGELLNYFVYPYVEFDGKPLKDKTRVELNFTYRNV